MSGGSVQGAAAEHLEKTEAVIKSVTALREALTQRIGGKAEKIKTSEAELSGAVRAGEELVKKIEALMEEGDFNPLGQCYADLYAITGEPCHVISALTYLFALLQKEDPSARKILTSLGFSAAAIDGMKESGRVSIGSRNAGGYKVQKGGLTITVLGSDRGKEASEAPIIPSEEALKNFRLGQELLGDRQALQELELKLTGVELEIEELTQELQSLKPGVSPVATCTAFAAMAQVDGGLFAISEVPEGSGDDWSEGLDTD